MRGVLMGATGSWAIATTFVALFGFPVVGMLGAWADGEVQKYGIISFSKRMATRNACSSRSLVIDSSAEIWDF